MRQPANYAFRFHFLNKSGTKDRVFPTLGRINREAVMLGDAPIFYEDILAVKQHEGKVIISTKPYITTARKISENIIPNFSSILISTAKTEAPIVKSAIDRRLSEYEIEKRLNSFPSEKVKRRDFKKIECPTCAAYHDLTYKKHTRYLYCKYCETLFDHYRHPLPGNNEYKTCPECNYYGKIRTYKKLSMYYLKNQDGFLFEKVYCCDTCYDRFFREELTKNLTLIIGAVFMLGQKYQSYSRMNPYYSKLTKANRLAFEGKAQDVDRYYSDIIFRITDHPGIHLNYGMMYFKSGKEERALHHFHKALEACFNYQPVIDIVKKIKQVS